MIDLEPRRAEAYNNLGAALQTQGKLEEAELAFRAATALRSADPTACLNLGNVLASQEKTEEAVNVFHSGARLEPDQPWWTIRAAAVCPAVFDSAEAINRYYDELLIHYRELALRSFRSDWSGVGTIACPPPSP